MYTENEKREINWGAVVKKGLIGIVILLIILLVIWLVSKIGNADDNTTNNNENANKNQKQTLKLNNETLETYSEAFISNFQYLQDTGRNYFLIHGPLPSEGDSTTLTLKELIAQELILPFADQYGKSCDENASYVRLTNINGKYTMTVKLACDTEEAKVSEQLGCNQFCTSKECTNDVSNTVAKVTEYEFRQAYSANGTTYSCPSGYSLAGNKCYKGAKSTINATKNTTKYCPNGYKERNGKCVATGETINATVNYNYTCPAGYTPTGSGANTKCISTSSSSIAATAHTTYTCPAGYTKNGTKCTKSSTSTIKATKNSSSSCPSGYTKSGSKCIKTAKYSKSTTYTCPSGYTKSGSGSNTTCYRKTSSSGKKYFSSYPTNISKSCSYLGYKPKDNCTTNCNKAYYTFYCTESVKVYANAKKSTKYTCPSGYTKSGSGTSTKCTKKISVTTSNSYSCPSGYTKNGTKCTKSSTSTVNATANTTYSCSTGYLSGKRCYYSSSNTINANKNSSYSCPSGYVLNGKSCKAKDQTTDLRKAFKYSCPSGYYKVGSGASSKCVKNNSSSINATASTSTVTKYRYKWSTSTTLAGWERTGKTRSVNAKVNKTSSVSNPTSASEMK